MCDARGLPTDELLAAANIARSTLADPDGRVAPEALLRFWQAGYERLSDPALSLHVAESLPRGAYRVIEFLASHSATVGEAFEKLVQYFAVIDNSMEMVLDVRAMEVGFGPATADPGVPLPAIEYMLAASYLRIRAMTEVGFSPTRIELVAERTSYAAELERVFRCPVVWRAAAHRLWFSRATWESVTASPDRELFTILEDHARALQARSPVRPGLVDRIVSILDDLWGREEPTLASVAKKLGVSTRTLQRRTREQGRSIADLIDDARRRAAMRWLSEPNVSLGEVAFLLHFADQATFTRAVKRWTGQTPAVVRARSMSERAG